MNTKHMPQSCYALGNCQRLKPACEGCTWKLAPGVVEGPFKRLKFAWLRRNWRSLVYWPFAIACLFSLVFVVMFLAGYLGARHG
jgi:hypothetical protein